QFWHLARPGARTGVYLRVPASSGQAFFILLQPYLLECLQRAWVRCQHQLLTGHEPDSGWSRSWPWCLAEDQHPPRCIF
ncbi:hypothetical protein LINPERHAP1_LOCUS14211, partial [Linum perenne]